jgi:hypothetical protein
VIKVEECLDRARMIPEPSFKRPLKNSAIPDSKEEGVTTAAPYWLPENTGVMPFAGVPEFDLVQTVPRRAAATTTFSRQLLLQNQVDSGTPKRKTDRMNCFLSS